MPRQRMWMRSVVALTLLTAGIGLACMAILDRPPPARAKLAVIVVFDQLRGDYLQRWNDHFGNDGFRRLQNEGIWFQNCHYPYAMTLTAAGHASIATGCSPNTHGVIGNDWYDRAAGSSVYCVDHPRYAVVPAAPDGDGKLSSSTGGASPHRLLVATVADALKEATDGRGKVVSLSFKDRSAILPGGKQPDACYWFDGDRGIFVTSTFYRDRPHPWVAEFNRQRPADAWFSRSWERCRPEINYDLFSGADDVSGEDRGSEQGRAFPHPLHGGDKQPGKKAYRALYNSPFGNNLLLDLARKAIDAEQLGQDAWPDLLCISFSSNDAIGHCWGPDSHEVFDVTLRSDDIVRDLLQHLDARVGKGNYLLTLTADHGVCPLPEVARSNGLQAGRIDPSMLVQQAEKYLDQTFGSNGGRGKWFEATRMPWFYLDPNNLRERQLDQPAVEQALADWLRQQPGIQTTYTRTQLQQGVPADDAIGQRMVRSFHPERSGDVVAVQKPYHLFTSPFATGTTHGAPHPYDTHVPMLVFGPGIAGGSQEEPVTPQAVTPIVGHGLGFAPPATSETPLPRAIAGR